jgi:uncharacterized alkaline shock family protein YloU
VSAEITEVIRDMANEHENGTNYTIYENGDLGEVKIADEVVAVIAGIAATEVEGVAGMAGSSGKIQREIISRLGMKVLSKGVSINVSGNEVEVVISVILHYGCSIPEVTAAIQDKVKREIETMTGLTVTSVNVRVVDVNLENE